MAPHLPGTILVIDDEPSVVRALAALLRRDGYRVATAPNGRHALAQLQEQPYDVILCDLRMPELDGPAFYAILTRQYPALRQRVIFLTGDTRTCRRDAAMRRHLLYQTSCMFPFALLALALSGENSLQHLLFSLQGWKILPGLKEVGNCSRVPLVTISAHRHS
jgi:CheY-like chemotaxis protein